MNDEIINTERSKYTPHNLNGGRKKLFPNDETLTRTITLPVETWNYLYDNFDSLSVAIFDAVNAQREASK